MGQDLVDRATSDTLIAPDWVLNGEVCNDINQDARLVQGVVKALKKRMGHKNPKVQILALSLLESMIKECGEVVHAYVAEKEIPKEMVKIAKKKPDLRVKQKILFLVETWNEFFGWQLGLYPQYYAAYQELLNSGFLFPEKEVVSSALVVHPLYQQALPFQSNHTSEHTEYHEKKSLILGRSKDTSSVLSLSDMKDAHDVVDVLSEMLNDFVQRNKQGLNQEVIVKLVCKCRTNKERVVKLLASTTDEYIISKAAALNDDLDKVLERHKKILAEPLLIEKSFMPPKQENGSVEQETSKETNSKRSVPRGEDDKLPSQQHALPDSSPRSIAMLSASENIKEPLIDLSCDDFFQWKSNENAVSIIHYELDHTASSQQVPSLTDMFKDLLSNDPNENHGLTSYNNQNQTTLPVQPIVHINSNLPNQRLSAEIMPRHVEPTNVHANGNLPAVHLPKSTPSHLEPTVHVNRCFPDQHLPKTVPFHAEPVVHTNRNSPDPVQPKMMSWHVEQPFYENSGNLNSMAWRNDDGRIQTNSESKQWNHTIGTNDDYESLPPPPWETHASDINIFQDNQKGFQTTYPTQLPQSYQNQHHQLYQTQKHQLYPNQQHKSYLNQQPQQILTGQECYLQPMESTTNSPCSEMHDASFANQQAMYTNQIDPYYNQNMYSYGYGYSYGPLNQENLSIYNSQRTTLVEKPYNFGNHWGKNIF